MQYIESDRGHFDYDPVYHPAFGNRFLRGPLVGPVEQGVACIGAAQTMGRFCHEPFPSLLGQALGIPCQNLGVGGSGPSFFSRPPVLELLASSRCVVVQVLSGRSVGSSRFALEPGRIRGICQPSGERMLLQDFLHEVRTREGDAAAEAVIEETRRNWVEETRRLLDGIEAPKVLLWLSKREPGSGLQVGPWLTDYPHLVDGEMLDQVIPHADAFVEVTSEEGLPQKLWRSDRPVVGADRGEDGFHYNRYYPSPEMHRLAAEALLPVVRDLLARGRAAPSA